jgi:tungstate transport system substrate-binding protein
MQRQSVVVLLFAVTALAFIGSAAQTSAQEGGAATPAATAPLVPAGPTHTPIPRLPGRVLLATTTSTQDSGLLDYILPDFEKKYNVKVDVIAVGTGQSLQLGARGDADVVLTHARAQEEAFVKAGNGTVRYDVMYNDFVILGPSSDPAGIKGLKSATEAFRKIAEKRAPFISRGDNSGTEIKEKSIWAKLNITPKGDWYVSAGQGMGAVLTMAGETQAYTLSDRATYARRKGGKLELEIVVEGDQDLFNPYSVIPVNPAKHPQVDAKLGQAFADWMTALDTQALIASYKINGQQMFVPDSEAWRKAHATATPEATQAATKAAAR